MPGYILCATPRSGTTLLCALLTASGVAGVPRSYFRRESRAGLRSELGVQGSGFGPFLDAVRRAGTQGGRFGLRLMAETRNELLAELRGLYGPAPDGALLDRALGSMRYIHLSRQDIVAQAISRLRAEQSGLWHRWDGGGEVLAPTRPGGEVYDGPALADHLRRLRDWDAGWQNWFAAHHITPLSLTYEGLAADPQASLAQVLAFVGADPALAADVAVSNRKLADATSADWAARFRAEHPDLV